MKRNRRNGFTLIEIMVVVLIIAMLSVFVAPKVLKRFGKAKYNMAIAGVALVEKALDEFAFDCDRYPTEEEGINALLERPAEIEEGKWSGPYLKRKQLIDPWGHDFIYMEQGTVNQGSYDVVSYGADGVAGGEGENADITNE